MAFTNPEALVTTEWLAEHLEDHDVRVIDATFHLPHADRDAYEEYTYRHIPGASYFPIDEIADTSVILPHMLPDAQKFKETVEAMGIGPDTRVIVYDGNGGYMAAMRVWWMFRCFGHESVAVLDGGLLRWGKEKRPLESIEPILPPAHFEPKPRPELVKSRAQILANIEAAEYQVIDARSEGRFGGVDHEPRPTERRGHIPGSINLPFVKLMDPSNDFTMRSVSEIAAAFDEAGVDLSRPVISSCGSGVTACVVTFALHLLGQSDTSVYDGSWAEWGNDADVPIGP
ncbi:MAG: 3-mercaptopyruvate sulfurtransferase [Rhodospirillaceae bacterium]|nr:3-mercaptopyruvate sulfurtransferase [Rhodospirillaceae bacterium]